MGKNRNARRIRQSHRSGLAQFARFPSHESGIFADRGGAYDPMRPTFRRFEEGAMRAAKRKSPGLRLKLVSAAVMSCFAGTALANPTGPISPPPTVNIAGVGTNVVTIANQPGAGNAIIRWEGFSIGVGELTQFANFANRAVLNRVEGGDMSSILGTLRSDGRVFLINRNGITIGAGAVLDLPGFIGSSLHLSDDDFNAGRMRFTPEPGVTAGPVVNEGNISTALYPTGQVYLVGPSVTNGGVITSPNGEVVLAAGESVEIVNPGTPGLSVVMTAPDNQAVNMGQIFADSGRVGMFGGLVTQDGAVYAGGAVMGPDGTIKLVATDTTTFSSGSNTSGGALDIDTGDLVVAGSVNTGPQDIHASGGVIVQNEVGSFAYLGAQGGQTIHAGYVEVNGRAGGNATIINLDGSQQIVTTSANGVGEGLAVRAMGGGAAFIGSPTGPQTIEVHDADYAVVQGVSGFAGIDGSGGPQSISMTGAGANAIRLEGASVSGSGFQTVAAGGPGEHGSITLEGANARITTAAVAGGTQTVGATETVEVLGGSMPGGSSAGIFHAGTGAQSIGAGTLVVQGGAGGSGNTAQVNSANGVQMIDAGSISVSGGSDGLNNFAFIRSQAAPQSIHAGTLMLNAGTGGAANFAGIFGAEQYVTVDGDATLSGGATLTTPSFGGGALMGGATSLPTNLTLTVGGDLTMNGGAIPGSGAALGASNAGVQPTEIHVQVGGDVRMNPGTGTGSRMGAAPGNSLGGSIHVEAGGEIYLGSAGPDRDAVIRTSADVSLIARQITQDPDAKIDAGSLAVHTQQGALLGGTNTVGQFSAINDWFGDVTLRNASPLLTLTSLQNFGGGFGLQQTGDVLVNGLVISGPQAIDVAGTLTVRPGAAGPAQLIGNGGQTVTADAVAVEGGSAGGNSAAIVAGSGPQTINAGAGGIIVKGGAAGTNNFAMIHQGDPLASQTVTSTGPVLLEGGSGNFNFALIRSLGAHQGLTFGDTAVLAGAGGIDNFATIQGLHQDVTVHGDLSIAARDSVGTPSFGGGARIGGPGGPLSSSTDLALQVNGNLTMTAGDVSGTGVSLGGHLPGDLPAVIAANVSGNITLNGGTAPDTIARIGSADSGATAGNVALSAGGNIALNSSGPDRYSVIRTLDHVSLTAQQITQGAHARIEAGGLSVQTSAGALLVGMNAVDMFNASNWASGNVEFNNTSPLLTVVNVINPIGAVSLQQAGDMRVTGDVASGVQSVEVTGGLVVQNEPGGFAQLGAQGGQTIHAGSVEVNGVAGGSAGIFNFGGVQHVATSSTNTAGEGLAVRAAEGGFAAISAPTGPLTIYVHDAARVVIDAASGFARIEGTGGPQSISLTGGGDNQLVLGSPGARYQSIILANDQTIVAGSGGENGGITVYGTDDGSFGTALILTLNAPGGTQTVSTSGALQVFGGSAPSNGATGVFANGFGGHQTIQAESILLQGGDGGFGNSAMIGANSGSQTIAVGPGGITLRGGEAGGNNFAMINQASTDPAATQTIFSAGPVLVEGGSGSFNFAMIRAFGAHQGLELGDTTLLAGATGIDNFSSIQGRSQDMAVHGDLTITARGSGGSPTVGGGARIGGTGGASPSATDLRLNVDGDFTMTGGDVAGTGVLLGNSPTFLADTDIAVVVGGNIALNGGSVPSTFAVIGSRGGSLAGGDISLQAGGSIALNSAAPEQASLIRTTDGVSLTAQSIMQGPDARIEAGSLVVQSTEGASLVGMNSVELLAMQNTVSGGVDFHNASALLTVAGIDQVPGGALNLEQDGSLLITGDVRSGVQSMSATGDMTIAAGAGPGVTVEAHGAQVFNVGGSFSLLGGTALGGYAQTLASGPVHITTGDDLNVRGGSNLLAYALMYGEENIHLTVGNELHVDGGTGLFAFARVQTRDLWAKIFLSFPNASSGSYFVDGREGASSHGLNGFFNGFVPARPGRGLILSYGL
jgi:filamentous hemagglutinin family protein